MGQHNPPENIENLTRNSTIIRHLAIFATQECCGSICQSFFCNKKLKWRDLLKRQFGNEYQEVVFSNLNAMSLCIYCHKSIAKIITNVEIKKVTCGLLNCCPNKGAIGCSFRIHQKTFMIICCHLASGQNKLSKRNKNFAKIEKHFSLDQKDSTFSRKPSLCKEFDYVIWCGDFNYRLNGNHHDLIKLLDKKDYQGLVKSDQLIIEKKKKALANHFLEETIYFDPTYKFIDKTDFYKYRSSQNVSYTDRIIYGGLQESKIKMVKYESISEMLWSDHKPVLGQFEVEIDCEKNSDEFVIVKSKKCCTIF